jgi:hypothetical protein
MTLVIIKKVNLVIVDFTTINDSNKTPFNEFCFKH